MDSGHVEGNVGLNGGDRQGWLRPVSSGRRSGRIGVGKRAYGKCRFVTASSTACGFEESV